MGLKNCQTFGLVVGNGNSKLNNRGKQQNCYLPNAKAKHLSDSSFISDVKARLENPIIQTLEIEEAGPWNLLLKLIITLSKDLPFLFVLSR